MCFIIDENPMEIQNSSENEEIAQINENMEETQSVENPIEIKNSFENEEIAQIYENMEDTQSDEITCDCDCDNNFDKDRVFNLLKKLYPNLREEIMYTAPEILWLKIKHITGVDIIDIMNSIEKNDRKRRIDSHVSPCAESTKNT